MEHIKPKRFVVHLIILMLCISMCACAKAGTLPQSASSAEHAVTWQEQYDLGVRFVSEGNYQEAILAFTAAIEIDPKQPDAYYSRGDAYAALAADADDEAAARRYYENAMADYRRAGELGRADGMQRADDMEKALDKLNQPSLEKELQRIQQESEPLLRELLGRFEADDPEGAAALLSQAEYITLCDSMMDTFIELSKNGRIDEKRYFQQVYEPEYDGYYYSTGTDCINDLHIILEAENGQVVALYHNHFCYYGQWESGTRSGHGIWVGTPHPDFPTDGVIFEGDWSSDRPNGTGTIVYIRGGTSLNSWSEPHYMIKDEGSFRDGFYHGTFHRTEYDVVQGLTVEFEPFVVYDGVLEADHVVLHEIGNGSAVRELHDCYREREKGDYYHDDYYEWGVDPERDWDKLSVPGIITAYSNVYYYSTTILHDSW